MGWGDILRRPLPMTRGWTLHVAKVGSPCTPHPHLPICFSTFLQVRGYSVSQSHLLFDDEDDVAGDDAGRLVRLAVECDLLAVAHALGDVHLQHLALRHHFLSGAGLALVAFVDDLPLTAAGGASALELLHHAGADLSELDLYSADCKYAVRI